MLKAKFMNASRWESNVNTLTCQVLYNKKLNNAIAILYYYNDSGFPNNSNNYHKNIFFPQTLYYPVIENLFNINTNEGTGTFFSIP